MDYIPLYHYLHKRFSLNQEFVELDEVGLSIRNFNFSSDSDILDRENHYDFEESHPLYAISDAKISENNEFRYSLVMPQHAKPTFDKVILLLHGLNERKWEKYLPWAASMVHQTGLPVLMFPISFHMNRAPEKWNDPRSIYPLLKQKAREEQFRFDTSTSIANYALSERLIQSPERFFTSGYQSINDVHHLIASIQKGIHPNFEKGTLVNIFAYSIGAFLTEILMIANPEGLLDQSRFVFFCGGALFSGMNPTSKYILNKTAFERIQEYYLHELETQEIQKGIYGDILSEHPFGEAFRAMMCPHKFTAKREKVFDFYSKNIKAITLKKDEVVPSKEVYQTFAHSFLKHRNQVEELDFDYPYSHELPFDAKLTKYEERINRHYADFMNRSATFLA